MLVTDKFMFIHVPKTGGTSVWDVLMDLPETKVLHKDDHGLRQWVPKDLIGKDLPSLAFVRNPFAWYWSLWNYASGSKTPPVVKFLIDVFSENGKRDFAKTVSAMQKPSGKMVLNVMTVMNSPKIDDSSRRFATLMAERLVSSMKGDAIGLYSWIHSAMVSGDDVFIGKTESLNDDLKSFLVKTGYSETDIPSCKRLNVSTKGIPKGIYPQALIDEIASRDQMIFSIGKYDSTPLSID